MEASEWPVYTKKHVKILIKQEYVYKEKRYPSKNGNADKYSD